MTDEQVALPISPAEWENLTLSQRATIAEAWHEHGRPVPAESLANMSPAEIEGVRQAMGLMSREWHRIETERATEARKWKPKKRVRVDRDKHGRLINAVVEVATE